MCATTLNIALTVFYLCAYPTDRFFYSDGKEAQRERKQRANMEKVQSIRANFKIFIKPEKKLKFSNLMK
jgi:hypothetical protein